jgi:hypothetical protein
MPHNWVEDRPADYTPHPPSGRAKPPWWKCTECHTRAESWRKPSGTMRVSTSNTMGSPMLTCEEYIVKRIMES